MSDFGSEALFKRTAAADGRAARVVVLDADALATLARLDPTGASKLVQRVLTTYRSSLARLMGQLRQARQLSDLATLRLVTHTLKSSSASVGAMSLSAMCGEAEIAARDGRPEVLPSMLAQVEAEALLVDAAVEQLLSVKSSMPT